MRRSRYPYRYRRSLLAVVVRATWRPMLVLLLGFGPFVLCFCSQSTATDTPNWTAAPTQPADYTFNDLELGLRARKVLADDAALAPHKLGVTVRNRVAVLWGNVPNSETSRRAAERLTQVLGITRVDNQLHVKAVAEKEPNPADLPPLKERVPLAEPEVPQPVRREVAEARRPANTAQELSWQPAERRSPSWRPKNAPNSDVPPAEHPPSLSVPNRPPASPVSTSTTKPAESLADAVEALRVKEDRFKRVRPEVKDGVVYLRGNVQRWEHLYELARSVSVLPGVKRVILEDVQTTNNP